MIQPRHGWMSLWRHFFNRERNSAELTPSMIEWQEQWNWDILKVNPPACYHALDWGSEYEFFSDPHAEPRQIRPAIRTLQDLESAASFHPAGAALSDQLVTIRNLRAHFGPSLPIVQTVFAPIEVAHRLMTGRPALLDFMREDPRALERLLANITAVYREYCMRCLQAGADGIFFATKWASSKYMSWKEYERFGSPYEQEILESLRRSGSWTILHVCGDSTHLGRMLRYDVDVFSYDFFAEGALSPQHVAAETGKWVLGGIDPELLRSAPGEAFERLKPCLSLDRWMAGPSCVVPSQTGDDAVQRIRSLLTSSLSA